MVIARGLPPNLVTSLTGADGDVGMHKLRRWLLQVAKYLLQNARRKYSRQKTVPDSDAIDVAADRLDPFEWAELRQRERILAAALETLTMNERAVFLAHELEDVCHEDIAAQMGRPIGTVYRLLSTARAKLVAFYARLNASRAKDAAENAIDATNGPLAVSPMNTVQFLAKQGAP